MSERLILPSQSPDEIYVIDANGREIRIHPDDMWMYEPDAYRTGGEQVQILSLDDLPKEEWMKQGDNDD